MRNFSVNMPAGSDLSVSGDSLVGAIEHNFSFLARKFGVGNAAGYVLDRVRMEYKDGILGGKGGVELRITAHGNDNLVGYDPTSDTPKDTVIWIRASRDDLPEPYEFQINREAPSDPTPFDAVESAGAAAGYAMAIMDEIAMRHSAFPPSVPPQQQVTFKNPNALKVNPRFALERMRGIMTSCRPKQDKETSALLDRLSELFLQLADAKTDYSAFESDALIYQLKGRGYFLAKNKITALAAYRVKAGLTGKQLADAVGISERMIRNYENPRTSTLGDAKYSVVQALANALNVNPDQLVNYGTAVLVDKE